MTFAEKTIASAIYSENLETSEISMMYRMSKSADAHAFSVGMTYIFTIQVHSEDLKIQEKSHRSRFFCVLRSLGVTCKQA